MLTIVAIMALTLVVSGLVLAYVAFPHRGEDLPLVPGAGRAMRKGVDSLPTLEPSSDEKTWTPAGRS